MKKGPLIALAVLVLIFGSMMLRRSKGAGGTGDDAIPTTPKESAAQVEQVFQQAVPEVKHAATTAADAMRTGDFERAVVSLQVIRQQENLTLEQGMAIHNSMANLESQLISRIEAGDQNAKRAFELLKKSKRDR